MASRVKLAARPGPHTFDDFCEMVREDQKADLINGEIYMASPENTDANELFLWLATLMNSFVRKRKLGKVYGSRVAVRLDDQNAPEPDILFVRTEHLDRVHRGRIAGPCDLAIEIVSPEQVVHFLRLGARNRYREVRPQKGEYQSEVLTGFWLRPEWLWQDPLPDELDTIQQILSRKASP